MATSTGKTHCAKCGKDRCTLRCGGCLQDFCFNHLADHRHELMKQLDDIDSNRDLFRHSLTERMKEPTNHPLIQQIEQWKSDSIKVIEKTADEAKQVLITHTTGHFHQIEDKLNKLTSQLREIREENDFNEINLRGLQVELTQLTAELDKPSNVSIRHDSSSFINKIYVDISGHKPAQPTMNPEKLLKMVTLISRLNTTHEQTSEYSCRRSEQLSEEVEATIARIVADVQVQQQNLSAGLNARLAVIDEEYKIKLQRYIEELNVAKAQNTAALEKDAAIRHEMILEDARRRIDELHEEANRLKLAVLREAQAQANARIQTTTVQVSALSPEMQIADQYDDYQTFTS